MTIEEISKCSEFIKFIVETLIVVLSSLVFFGTICSGVLWTIIFTIMMPFFKMVSRSTRIFEKYELMIINVLFIILNIALYNVTPLRNYLLDGETMRASINNILFRGVASLTLHIYIIIGYVYNRKDEQCIPQDKENCHLHVKEVCYYDCISVLIFA